MNQSDLEPLSYFFGAVLGDGCADLHGGYGRVTIACADFEIVDKCYWDITNYFSDLRFGRRYSRPLRSGVMFHSVVWNNKEFYNLIQIAIGSKQHIPEYIWDASREARLDFLAGLMDTDGGITHQRGSVYQAYFTGGDIFVEQFREFCSTLGIKLGKRQVRDNRANHCYCFYLRKESLRESGFRFYVSRKQDMLEAWMRGS